MTSDQQTFSNNFLNSRLTFEQLIDQAPVMLWFADTDGRCVYFSKQWYDYTGQAPESALGRGWVEAVHPDDRASAEEAFDLSASNGGSVKHLYRLRSKSGEYRWMLDRCRPLYDGAVLLGYIGSITDINNRKAAEEKAKENEIKHQHSERRFRQLLETLPLGVYVADSMGRLKFANRQMLEIWGSDCNSSDLQWSGAYKIYDSSGKEITVDEYPGKRAFLERRPLIEEVTVEARSGERKHLMCYPQPLFDADGVCTGLMNIVVDITEKQLAEQKLERLMIDLERQVEKRTIELKQANDDLMRANYDLEQYAFIASHDLQEPLRKIRMFADRLSNSRDDADRFDLYLQKIQASAEKMSTLINDVLNYSTLLKNTPQFAEVDLNEIAHETLEALASTIAAKKAKITVGSLPVVQGVDSQLLLLFNNIVSNALTFTDACPVIAIDSMEVSGESIIKLGADPMQRYVKIEFKDNGIGFDEAYKEKIFEIFERWHTTGSHTGNGMGLPLCKKIIENHKGVITASSRKGCGSIFEVYLPA